MKINKKFNFFNNRNFFYRPISKIRKKIGINITMLYNNL